MEFGWYNSGQSPAFVEQQSLLFIEISLVACTNFGMR